MREVIGDLWSYPADVRVIPTNGQWKMTDSGPMALMGEGAAAEASRRYPAMACCLGRDLRDHGARAEYYVIPNRGASSLQSHLVAFPTKHAWWEKSQLALIRTSAEQLIQLDEGWSPDAVIVLPRVGFELGWADVRPVLAGILDDRFVVMAITGIMFKPWPWPWP